MPLMLDPEEQFRAYLTAFRREAQRLRLFLAIYRYLHERRHDHLAELNIAPAFFQIVLTALRSGIVIWCHKFLVGGSREEVSIGTFLNFVRQNLPLFSTDSFRLRRNLPTDAWQVRDHVAPTSKLLRHDRRRVAALTGVGSLQILRDQFHAHFDPRYFLEPERLEHEAPLTWGELNQIRDVIEDILNRYSIAYDGNSFLFEPLNQFDVEHIIEALQIFVKK